MDKMDPLIYITIKDKLHTLAEKTNAGTHAIWKEQVQMEVQDAELVTFQVYDEDVGADKYLAHGAFSIFQISGKPVMEFRIPLFSKGEEDGTLTFDV